jgi:hypothetical protein
LLPKKAVKNTLLITVNDVYTLYTEQNAHVHKKIHKWIQKCENGGQAGPGGMEWMMQELEGMGEE